MTGTAAWSHTQVHQRVHAATRADRGAIATVLAELDAGRLDP